jgi:outer membrane protein
MRSAYLHLASLLAVAGPLAAQGVPVPVTSPPAAGAAEPQAVRPIALDEALSLARRNAPAAVAARGQMRVSNYAVRSAYAAFIPTFALNASTSRSSPATARVNPTTGELQVGRWGVTEGFSSNVDLFNGRRLFDIRAAKADVRAAEASELAERFNLDLQVRQQYYASLAAAESEAAAQSQLSEAEQGLRVASVKVRAQAATRSDSLRARIQVGEAQLALLSAQTDRQTADAALTRLVATPFPVTASPSGLGAEPPASLDSATLARLAEEGPAVREAAANAEAARAASRAARAPYLPTLSASYGQNRAANGGNFDIFPPDFRTSAQLRIGISYPIFNQLTREESVVRADVAATNAEATLRDARLAAQQTLTQYVGALRTAQQRVDIQTQSVAAAEEDLRVQQQRYELGASLLLDVLTSQTQLTQARVALIQARFDARVARAQLEALVGRPL